MANLLNNRVSKLEFAQGPSSYSGAIRIIWHGQEDDEAVKLAGAQARRECKLLIVRRMVANQVHAAP